MQTTIIKTRIQVLIREQTYVLVLEKVGDESEITQTMEYTHNEIFGVLGDWCVDPAEVGELAAKLDDAKIGSFITLGEF